MAYTHIYCWVRILVCLCWNLCVCIFFIFMIGSLRGGFEITPNEDSAILAFYSDTCALVRLGSHWILYLPSNSLISGRPGRMLSPLNHGMHPFCRHF